MNWDTFYPQEYLVGGNPVYARQEQMSERARQQGDEKR